MSQRTSRERKGAMTACGGKCLDNREQEGRFRMHDRVVL